MNETKENKSLGALIVESLKAKGWVIEKLSQATGIPENFLTAFIEEKFEKLPSAPYIHGYLTKIAEALNLDGQGLWQRYLKNNQALRHSGEKDRLPRNRFALPAINKKVILVAVFILFILGYILIRALSFFSWPEIYLSNVTDNLVVNSQEFKIIGKIQTGTQLTINDEPVYSESSGQFEKIIKLQPGSNVLVFKAKKIPGRESVFTKQIFYQPLVTSTNSFINVR